MNDQKTAVGLVNELSEKWMNYYPSEICKSLAEIKEAIIYEQGKACASFAKQCNETAQDALKFRKLEQSATMRPISELPDKVPDGCVAVLVSEKCAFSVYSRLEAYKSAEGWQGFYILPLPLPVKERKLHKCYMPECGRYPEIIIMDGWYRVACECGLMSPGYKSKQMAIKAWGVE